MSPKAHHSPGEHSCACDTDEHTLSVTFLYFPMLIGYFSSAGKLNLRECFHFGKSLQFENST